MSIRHRVMAGWRSRRTRLERNHALLRRAADEIGREFEGKSYEELRDHGAEDFDSDWIVDGVRVHTSAGFPPGGGSGPPTISTSDRTGRSITKAHAA